MFWWVGGFFSSAGDVHREWWCGEQKRTRSLWSGCRARQPPTPPSPGYNPLRHSFSAKGRLCAPGGGGRCVVSAGRLIRKILWNLNKIFRPLFKFCIKLGTHVSPESIMASGCSKWKVSRLISGPVMLSNFFSPARYGSDNQCSLNFLINLPTTSWGEQIR